MPPKKAAAKAKLHELAVEVAAKTIISDPSKKKQFAVGKQFATGGFGRIYTCNEVGSSEELVVKIEPSGNGPLFTEVNVFQRILKLEMIEAFKKQHKIKTLGLPWVISAGVFDYGKEKLRYMIIPKYETSLESVREKSGGKLAEKVSWEVARAVLESLEYIHSKKYTHADVKAANILLRQSKQFTTAVLVDFGLARLSSSNEDKPDKKRAHNGTAIFTSRDAHRGCHPSFRGDLEILAYNIIYWITGRLPWLDAESAPDKVYSLKQDFCKDVATSLKTCVPMSANSTAALTALFKIVDKTEYTDSFDFSAAYKIVDKAIRDSAEPVTTGRKRGSIEMIPSSVKTVRKSSQTRDVATTSTASTPQRQSAGGPSSSVRSSARSGVSRGVKSVKKIPSIKETPIDVIELSSGDDSPLVPAPAMARRRPLKVAPTPTRSSTTSTTKSVAVAVKTRRSGLGVVPGVRKVDSASVKEKEKENVVSSVTITPRAKPRAAATAKIPSATKKSPDQLRQLVPGVRNFAKGRRSVIITQISKKYRRIAARKANENDGIN